MNSELGARSMELGVEDPNGLHAQRCVLPDRVRWSIYLLLIAVAVGNMTGRLLSVNSVDKAQLEAARFSGATLRDCPYEIGRAMLITVNVLPLALMFVLLARLTERYGTTDWGRIFVVCAATFGTMLSAFAVVLNNHTVAAVSATVAIY